MPSDVTGSPGSAAGAASPGAGGAGGAAGAACAAGRSAELLGSLTTQQQQRTSARVIKKLRLDSAADDTLADKKDCVESESCGGGTGGVVGGVSVACSGGVGRAEEKCAGASAVAAAGAGAALGAEAGAAAAVGAGGKQRMPKALWSADEKALFFEALNEYGKEFDAITAHICAKMKKRGASEGSSKTKHQVSHFYYRTWHKLSKHVRFHDNVKKVVQELYALINYGEMRKKLAAVNEKTCTRLFELITHGTIVVRARGRSLRLRTPHCRALRTLNQFTEEESVGVRVPTRATVVLRARCAAAWARVQAAAHNPRAALTASLRTPLRHLLAALQRRWEARARRDTEYRTPAACDYITPDMLYQHQHQEQQQNQEQQQQGACAADGRAAREGRGGVRGRLALHVGPRPGTELHLPTVAGGERDAHAHRVCFASYLERLRHRRDTAAATDTAGPDTGSASAATTPTAKMRTPKRQRKESGGGGAGDAGEVKRARGGAERLDIEESAIDGIELMATITGNQQQQQDGAAAEPQAGQPAEQPAGQPAEQDIKQENEIPLMKCDAADGDCGSIKREEEEDEEEVAAGATEQEEAGVAGEKDSTSEVEVEEEEKYLRELQYEETDTELAADTCAPHAPARHALDTLKMKLHAGSGTGPRSPGPAPREGQAGREPGAGGTAAELVRRQVRRGWSVHDAGQLTIGDLYLMFGYRGRLELDYWWAEASPPLSPPAAPSPAAEPPAAADGCWSDSDQTVLHSPTRRRRHRRHHHQPTDDSGDSAEDTPSKHAAAAAKDVSPEAREAREAPAQLGVCSKLVNRPGDESVAPPACELLALTSRLRRLLALAGGAGGAGGAGPPAARGLCCAHLCTQRQRRAPAHERCGGGGGGGGGWQHPPPAVPCNIAPKPDQMNQADNQLCLEELPRWRRGRPPGAGGAPSRVVVQRLLPLLPKPAPPGAPAPAAPASPAAVPEAAPVKPARILPRPAPEMAPAPAPAPGVNRHSYVVMLSAGRAGHLYIDTPEPEHAEPAPAAERQAARAPPDRDACESGGTEGRPAEAAEGSDGGTNDAEEEAARAAEAGVPREPAIHHAAVSKPWPEHFTGFLCGGAAAPEEGESVSLSPSRLLRDAEGAWPDHHLHDFSLSSFLGHLESAAPPPGASAPASPLPPSGAARGPRTPPPAARDALHDASVDYMAKFADLAADLTATSN